MKHELGTKTKDKLSGKGKRGREQDKVNRL